MPRIIAILSFWGKDGQLNRKPLTFRSYLVDLLGFHAWPRRFLGIVRNAIGPVTSPFPTEKGRKIIQREARWHLAGYLLVLVVSIVFWTPVALIYWIAPMVLTKFSYELEIRSSILECPMLLVC